MASLFCRYGPACIGVGQCSFCGLTVVPPKQSVRSSRRNRFTRSRAPRPSPPCPSSLPRFPFLPPPPARYVDEAPASSLPPCSFFLPPPPGPLFFSIASAASSSLPSTRPCSPSSCRSSSRFSGFFRSSSSPRSSPPPAAVASSSSSGDGLGSLVCVAGRGLPLGFVREDQWQSSCSPEEGVVTWFRRGWGERNRLVRFREAQPDPGDVPPPERLHYKVNSAFVPDDLGGH